MTANASTHTQKQKNRKERKNWSRIEADDDRRETRTLNCIELHKSVRSVLRRRKPTRGRTVHSACTERRSPQMGKAACLCFEKFGAREAQVGIAACDIHKQESAQSSAVAIASQSVLSDQHGGANCRAQVQAKKGRWREREAKSDKKIAREEETKEPRWEDKCFDPRCALEPEEEQSFANSLHCQVQDSWVKNQQRHIHFRGRRGDPNKFAESQIVQEVRWRER